MDEEYNDYNRTNKKGSDGINSGRHQYKIGVLKLANKFHLGWNGLKPCKFESCRL